MKNPRPVPLKDVVVGAIKAISAKQEGSVSAEEISGIWKKAAGKEASRHSSPAQLKGKVLVVNVDSPTWIYQLNIQRARIEKRLSALMKGKGPFSIRLRAGAR